MINNRLYSEILQEFEKAETKADKVRALQKYDHPRFRLFLKYAFDPNVHFDVEVPVYRPAPEPAGLNFTYLHSEIPKMYRFIKNHPERSAISPARTKSLLVVILESLHKDEAALFVKLIKKNLEVKGLTAKVVKEAFPEMDL